MKTVSMKYCEAAAEAAAQAMAEQAQNRKAVVVGPVKVVRNQNAAGQLVERPNEGDKDLWVVISTNSEIDTALL